MAKVRQLEEHELEQWMRELGVELNNKPEDREEGFHDALRDGIALCQLVNTIRPDSVEEIKTDRDSTSAEDNILHFLQACNGLGVQKIFRLSDLTDKTRDFTPVLNTLQELYRISENLGMGLKPLTTTSEDELSPPFESEQQETDTDERDNQDSPELVVRGKFAFTGEGEDELVFDKGDIITVTKVVEGGWWEGFCKGKVGWFPGAYVEEIPPDMLPNIVGPTTNDKRNSLQQFYDLVINDIVETERAYTNDLQTLLSVYLVPLKTVNVLQSSDVDTLTGNLPEVSKWQQSFFRSIQDCSRLPLDQQNMGSVFLKFSNELELLYSAYCANHPKAVAVLTDNSDKLSSFMESKGAASPGILTLTMSLSKPFKRLEKYPTLLKELQRSLGEEHSDAENVVQAIETYTAISGRTQDVRKKKEAEYEMLSNPVNGYSGSCLMELGQCYCIIQGNQAISSEEVEEHYYLVFPERFIILGIGASLSGYEVKSNLDLGTVSIKKGQHSDSWPYPIEITCGNITYHSSLLSEKDQAMLVESVHQLDTQVPHRANSVTASRISLSRSSKVKSGYGPRLTRKNTGPIMRAHHWGFMSLRPAPPLKTQQLLTLRDRDLKSPKSAKKFIYPAAKKKLAFAGRSKSIEDTTAIIGNVGKLGLVGGLTEQDKANDTAILKVIEAYCASGKSRALIPDRHSLPIRHSVGPLSPSKFKSTPLPSLPGEDEGYDTIKIGQISPTKRSTTLPDSRKGKHSFSVARSPSPKAEKKSFIRKRTGSFDSHHNLSTKNH